MKKYKLVVSGGTFDHLHKGHEEFLTFQLAISDEVLIGITSDRYTGAKKGGAIEAFEARKNAVESFLKTRDALSRVRIVAIDDAGIPKEWNKLPIEAIVVTEATKKGAEDINKKRKAQHMPELAIEIFPMTLATDGKLISSTRIRKGAISRSGVAYVPSKLFLSTLFLPESLRVRFKKPMGELIKNNAFDYAALTMKHVVTVGDIATKTFLKRSLFPKLAIVDLIVERKKKYEKPSDIGFLGDETIITADNPAGCITPSLSKAIQEAFTKDTKRSIVILVSGEEDLAVLPVLLFSPLGYIIFYGQPGVGIVKVDVTEEQKKTAHILLNKLKIS